MFEKIRRWLAAHPNWTLVLIVLGALTPFLGKPFNLDDPLFIWAAHQIQLHPGNPYGFFVEWGWTQFPMWKVTENPPLACYYLALAGGIFGWSEVALHLAFLLPAILLVLGTHRLARQFCRRPLLAAMITLFSPVFLISSTTLMCDVLMLAFWVWAVVLWVEGSARDHLPRLALAGLLIALAEMTKYYAACLMPLLAVYSLACRRPLILWGQFLLLPLAVLCAYQYVTQAVYGCSLLYNAMDYAARSKIIFAFSKWNNGLIALAFAGGCLAPALFFAPLLWRCRSLGLLAGGAAAIAVGVCFNDVLWKHFKAIPAATQVHVQIQVILWAAAGLAVLALTVADLRSRRDVHSLLLTLWVIGTFVFAGFCNWTVNARSILPMTPAVAILIVRRLDLNQIARPNTERFCLAVCGVFALLLTWSDFSHARAVRQSVNLVRDKYARSTETIWFQGHWGFQYYMEQFGAKPVDHKFPELKPSDLVAVPAYNTNVRTPDPRHTTLLAVFTVAGPGWITTWNSGVGAAFYASLFGPLPFAFGDIPPEQVSVYVLQ